MGTLAPILRQAQNNVEDPAKPGQLMVDLIERGGLVLLVAGVKDAF